MPKPSVAIVSLGLVEVYSGDYMRQDGDGSWVAHDTETPARKAHVCMARASARSVLNFTVALYPPSAYPTLRRKKRRAAAAAAAAAKKHANGDTSKSLDAPPRKSAESGRKSLDVPKPTPAENGKGAMRKEPSTLSPRGAPITPSSPLSPGGPRREAAS